MCVRRLLKGLALVTALTAAGGAPGPGPGEAAGEAFNRALPAVSEDIKTEADLAKALQVSGFKAGTDGAARTLAYQLTVHAPITEGGEGKSYDVKIWYDPRTWKLFRRTAAIREGDVSGTL